jgi:uncharacterized protein involved in exopolysaccharide biosynthesis
MGDGHRGVPVMNQVKRRRWLVAVPIALVFVGIGLLIAIFNARSYELKEDGA